MEMKEKETTGMWLTEDKMKKSGDYSPIHDCTYQPTLQYVSGTTKVCTHTMF